MPRISQKQILVSRREEHVSRKTIYLARVINHEQYDVYGGNVLGHRADRTKIGRPGWLGNPFVDRKRVHRPDDIAYKEKVFKEFAHYFLTRVKTDQLFRKAVLDLRGQRIGCACNTIKYCHLRVVAKWLEAQGL